MSGDSGGGGTTTTTQELAPEQRRLLDLAFPAVENIANNTPTLFPGSAVAGFDPLQTQGQEQLLQAAGPGGSISQLGQGFTDFVSFLQGDALKLGTNPYLSQTVDSAQEQLGRNFNRQFVPANEQNAIQSGQFGGSRQYIAEGLGREGLARAQGDVATNLYDRGYQGELQARTSALQAGTQALGFAPQLSQLLSAPGLITSGVGQQRQQFEQQQLIEEQQKHLAEQTLPFNIAQDIAALAFGVPAGSTRTAATGGSPSGLQTALGYGSLAGSVLPSVFGL